jgi:2-polyprenyl-3-methyl-5-hydroxy-6-metoxy-1,4-benzoquinol methylase
MKYHFKNIMYNTNRDNIIESICKNKSVLHIGAADSPFTELKISKNLLLHKKLESISSKLIGIDIDQNAINYLKNHGINNILNIDLMDDNIFKLEKFDVIVFGETIEHLNNIGFFLDRIKKLMHNNTLLVVSTPNSRSFDQILGTLFGYEIIHEDHLVNFTYASLLQIMKRNGFDIETFYFTFLPREKHGISLIISKILCFIRNGFSDTLLCVCKLKGDSQL